MSENTWTGARRRVRREMDDLCESPAESGLLWAMLMHGGPDEYTFGPGCAWELRPQLTIRTPGRTYRVDFAVKRGDVRVAIEVDGHAYHHATEEQKAYDACRDWALGQMGWHVIRVEAWMVLRNPLNALETVVLPQLQQVEVRANNEKQKPIEHQNHEEFAQVEARFEQSIRAAEMAGHHDVAEENRHKIERMRARRTRVADLKRIQEAATDPEAERALLADLFARRAAKLGLGAG